MSDQKLRNALIRLAAENPEARPHLLPLLKESAEGGTTHTASSVTAVAEFTTALGDFITSMDMRSQGGNRPSTASGTERRDEEDIAVALHELREAVIALSRYLPLDNQPNATAVYAGLVAHMKRKLKFMATGSL